jgi:glycosyltransferase involved in cell wall biosynthesis
MLPNDGVQRFVWCGRFNPEKNVEGLLHAWAGFVAARFGVQLVLLGDGPLRDELLALAGSIGLRIGRAIEDTHSHVIFLGKVHDPAAYMLGARALLLSSYAEGLPMVVLEALSLGLPVLASDCRAGGVRTALLGQGECNPNRTDIEFTPAGALLPVPLRDAPATLRLWGEALATASQDTFQLSRWQAGAMVRASNFSSRAVRDRWLQAIDFGAAIP